MCWPCSAGQHSPLLTTFIAIFLDSACVAGQHRPLLTTFIAIFLDSACVAFVHVTPVTQGQRRGHASYFVDSSRTADAQLQNLSALPRATACYRVHTVEYVVKLYSPAGLTKTKAKKCSTTTTTTYSYKIRNPADGKKIIRITIIVVIAWNLYIS